MPPKKAAKKAGGHARKAFEHLGRVQCLAALPSAERECLPTLLSAADAAFQSHHYSKSAHLLRAAEHLLFAAVVDTNPQQLSRLLVKELQEEFDQLLERAAQHGHAEGSPQAIQRIYTRMREDAVNAMRRHDYRKALELGRGAEALTHVNAIDRVLPGPTDERRRLKA
jgi:hypothetical protein